MQMTRGFPTRYITFSKSKFLIIKSNIPYIMSELSELIEINRNIENQNREIIRLLKVIAGEKDDGDDWEYVPPRGAGQTEELPDAAYLVTSPQAGEVYFLDGTDIFRLSIKNNETVIDNIAGSGQTDNFKLQEMIANESVKRNQSLEDSTVILSIENCTNLPESLRVCYQQKAKNVYLPWSSMTQLVGAPDILMKVLKLDFYKTEEQLIEKLFKEV